MARVPNWPPSFEEPAKETLLHLVWARILYPTVALLIIMGSLIWLYYGDLLFENGHEEIKRLAIGALVAGPAMMLGVTTLKVLLNKGGEDPDE